MAEYFVQTWAFLTLGFAMQAWWFFGGDKQNALVAAICFFTLSLISNFSGFYVKAREGSKSDAD